MLQGRIVGVRRTLWRRSWWEGGGCYNPTTRFGPKMSLKWRLTSTQPHYTKKLLFGYMIQVQICWYSRYLCSSSGDMAPKFTSGASLDEFSTFNGSSGFISSKKSSKRMAGIRSALPLTFACSCTLDSHSANGTCGRFRPLYCDTAFAIIGHEVEVGFSR